MTDSCSRVTIVPGSLQQGRVIFKVSLSVQVDDAPNKATLLELAARETVERVTAMLIKRVPALAHAHLCDVASEVGIRTGRKSPGKYLLTRQDVAECHKADDSAGRGTWPIEKWGLARRAVIESVALEDYYDVPSGSLMSAAIGNLFFGGRHICAEEDAIASARVIGTCLATGFSAGEFSVRSLAAIRTLPDA
jgi:hypothetical protein